MILKQELQEFSKWMSLVQAECVLQRNEVAIILDVIFSSSVFFLSSFLLNLQERVILGLHKLARAPN